MPVVIDGTNGIGTPDLESTGQVTGTTGTFSGAVQASGVATNLYPLVSGTAVASTSGTSIDFTGIPSWAKRITVMFDSVSFSGTDNLIVQLGYSGGFENTSYVSASTGTTGSTGATVSSTNGFIIRSTAAACSISGHMTITNISGNKWVASHTTTFDGSAANNFGGGVKTISGGVLTQVRVSRTGTDTFDAGSINILWE